MVAFLWLILKFPKPTILTFSSLFREFVTASKRLSIALVESDFDNAMAKIPPQWQRFHHC